MRFQCSVDTADFELFIKSSDGFPVVLSYGCKVFGAYICLLIKAGEGKEYHMGRQLSPGQIATSGAKIGSLFGETDQSTRTILKKLVKCGAIEIESTNKYSVVTICNWSDYQQKEA
ncbi:MAG: hypothetical protein GY841_02925 [FCB group bacterium]|nr:hypothetical protein [FCB group bacterium]